MLLGLLKIDSDPDHKLVRLCFSWVYYRHCWTRKSLLAQAFSETL